MAQEALILPGLPFCLAFFPAISTEPAHPETLGAPSCQVVLWAGSCTGLRIHCPSAPRRSHLQRSWIHGHFSIRTLPWPHNLNTT